MMLFPNQFPNRMNPPRRPFGGNTFPGRSFNGQMNITPFTTQSQNSLTSFASKGVGGLSKTLNNVQQVLKVIESATPIVQQYGPMIKNLPAMYQMMKAFKEEDEAESSETDLDTIESLANKAYEPTTEEDVKQDNRSGQSVPKLFI